jgi:DNA-directed RNA polymerase specialized sigma24 family protein
MDTELVRSAQGGDKRAFTSLAAAMADRFLAASHRILRDISLAEDATQQALLSIWRDLPQLRDPARFEAWSYRLLVRACYAEASKTRRAAALASLPGMTASAPADIEVDGHAGKLIELTAPADAASCAAGAATLWDFPGQDDIPMALGERLPVRIVDADGVRVVIVASDYPGTSAWEVENGVTFDARAHADDQVEAQAIVDSIQINP